MRHALSLDLSRCAVEGALLSTTRLLFGAAQQLVTRLAPAVPERDQPRPSDVAAHDHASARLAFFGLSAVTFRHAMVSALRNVRASSSARRTDVAPRRPQVPLIGVKIAGSAAISICCCSGASFTMPQSLPG